MAYGRVPAKSTIAVAPLIVVALSTIILPVGGAEAAGRDPRRTFTLLDTDGDGFVSKAELLAAPRVNRTRSEDEVRTRREAIFARLDVNKDGRLSLEEVSASRSIDGKATR